MRDDERQRRVFGRGQKLAHRAQYPVIFVADVRTVDAAFRRDDARERTDLGVVGGDGGIVEQARAEAERARLHRGVEQPGHRRGFVRVRAATEVGDAAQPQRRMADERRDIHRRPGAIDRIGVGREVSICELLRRAEQVEGLGDLVVKGEKRRRKAAIADDDGGDALADLGAHLGPGEADEIVVRVHVDEARCDDAAARIDDRRVAGGQVGADRQDAVAAQCDIGHKARGSGAVDDGAAAKDQGGGRLIDQGASVQKKVRRPPMTR